MTQEPAGQAVGLAAVLSASLEKTLRGAHLGRNTAESQLSWWRGVVR